MTASSTTSPSVGAEPALTKGEITRATIIDAAMSLFEKNGYDATTMRAIAERAGVSVGNAYYYFSSKEALVQGFYERAAIEHERRASLELEGVDDLAERASTLLLAWVEEMHGFHEFAGTFLRTASDPSSPLSPFSAESAVARERAISLWRDVVDGSDVEIPAEIATELPEILWLFQMGVVLFWVHDRSDDLEATRTLIRRTVPLVMRAVEFSTLPMVREIVNDLTSLVGELRQLQQR